MRLHSMEECQKWITYRAYYPFGINMSMFDIKPDETNKYYLVWHVADIGGKNFQHDEVRITNNINKIIINYPQLQKIVDKLHIYICPKPSADTCNACANGDYICYFARSTQIPTYMTDYITGHELGHCVNFKLCSKHGDDNEKFRKYLELRNAPKGMCHVYVKWDKEKDEDIYEDKEDFLYLNGTQEEKRQYHGEWDANPLEWFAEDFRYLFGCEEGYRDYWGHKSINPPDEKIREFFLSL
jgi:hypothetical protein